MNGEEVLVTYLYLSTYLPIYLSSLFIYLWTWYVIQVELQINREIMVSLLNGSCTLDYSFERENVYLYRQVD